MADRWLVVGLGNPEAEYAGTRHNVGADTARLLAGRLGTSFKAHRTRGRVADTATQPGRTPLTLALPSGYMNSVGGPVQQLVAFYKVPVSQLCIVHDDLDLSFAALRLKRGGGTGGHNGLRDIERRLNSREFFRVRIGIGRPQGRQDPADYVLRRFPPRERTEIDVTLEHAADAVLYLIDHGLEATQNRYHAA